MSALAGTAPVSIQAPARFGVTIKVVTTLLITAGVPSVVAEESSDCILSVTDVGVGRYGITADLAGCVRCVGSYGSIESPANTYAASAVAHSALSQSAGTFEINTIQGTTLADPTTLSKVRYTLEFSTVNR